LSFSINLPHTCLDLSCDQQKWRPVMRMAELRIATQFTVRAPLGLGQRTGLRLAIKNLLSNET
jgi:hypothetical protein